MKLKNNKKKFTIPRLISIEGVIYESIRDTQRKTGFSTTKILIIVMIQMLKIGFLLQI